MFIIEHAISGFHRSISEVFALLEYCAAPIGSNGRFGVLEDGNYRLSRNVDNLTSTLRNIPEKQRQHLTLFPNLGMHREEYFNAPRRVFQSDLHFFLSSQRRNVQCRLSQTVYT